METESNIAALRVVYAEYLDPEQNQRPDLDQNSELLAKLKQHDPVGFNHLEIAFASMDYVLVHAIYKKIVTANSLEQSNQNSESSLSTIEAALGLMQDSIKEVRDLYKNFSEAVHLLRDIDSDHPTQYTKKLLRRNVTQSVGPSDPVEFKVWFINEVVKDNAQLRWVKTKPDDRWLDPTFRENLIQSAKRLQLIHD